MLLFRHISKVLWIISVGPVSSSRQVSLAKDQSWIVIQLYGHPMEQKLKQILDLLTFVEFMVTQLIPFASQIAFFFTRIGPVLERLSFEDR